MPRPREFDETAALERAMRRFWRTGYEGTSVADLMKATGLSRQSLYLAFRSKRALYLAALKRYHMTVLEPELRGLAEAADPGAAIIAYLRRVARGRPKCPAGCMVVLTAIELAPRSRVAADAVRMCLHATEAAFRRAIEAAISDGLIDRGVDPLALARQLTLTTQALHLAARCSLPSAYADAIIRPLAQALRAGSPR